MNAEQHETTKTAGILNKLPGWVFKMFMSLARFLDKHNCLPKFLIHASPFHTSALLTNVASLGIDAIYHHLYNFGTTGLFLAMGKKKKSYIYDDENNIHQCNDESFLTLTESAVQILI